jgi:hypothetical protein
MIRRGRTVGEGTAATRTKGALDSRKLIPAALAPETLMSEKIHFLTSCTPPGKQKV